MFTIDTAKRLLHRDLCADPLLHGLVLNLYLNGEQYPHRVENYFAIPDLDEPALAQLMRAHLQDEDKHIALYRKAITRLGQPVVELPLDDVFNHVICAHTPSQPRLEARDVASRRRERLGHFLAHLHFLERRVARSLEFHVEACAQSATDYSEKVVNVVLRDEQRHAAYTREAVVDLLPHRVAGAVLDLHRQAEARANLDFSSRQLSRLFSAHRSRFPASRRWLYGASCRLLRRMAAHA